MIWNRNGKRAIAAGILLLAVLVFVGLAIARGGYWYKDMFAGGTGTSPAGQSRHDDIKTDVAAPDYESLRQQLADYLQGKDATYGIYLKDLKSGHVMAINADMPFPAASTIKVPVVLYLNNLAARGDVDWNARVVYNSATDYQDGAGILQFTARDGDSYSLRVLSNLAITTSDNIANRMLMKYLGKDNIVAFMKELGGKTVYPGGENITTARDMGVYMEAVLDFARRHPDEGGRLLDDMANPIYHVGLPGKLPPNVTVAHKEGDVWGVANDVGIIFGRRPYILTILSQGEYDVDRGFSSISDISKIVYGYQEKLG